MRFCSSLLRGLLVALVVAAAGVASASASPPPQERFPVGSSTMQAAQDIARQHWGTDPCGGAVEVVWTALPRLTNAMARWASFGTPYAAPERNVDCRVELNVAASYDVAKLCTVVVHEYGHLAGQPHRDGGDEVMSAVYSKALPACEALAAAVEPPSSRRRGGAAVRSARR